MDWAGIRGEDHAYPNLQFFGLAPKAHRLAEELAEGSRLCHFEWLYCGGVYRGESVS